MASPLLSLRVNRLRAGGREILRDTAIEVRSGEIIGVAGHVGAGKTTIGLLAAGLLHRSPDMEVDAEVLRAPAGGSGASAGYLFSNPWTQMTGWGESVREEVAVGPENLNVPRARMREVVSDALRRTRAAHLADRPPQALSGGELQRVALASALAMEAPLLVLDEPTSQLDPDTAADLEALLAELARQGHGILLIEQNLELLSAVCQRLIVLADGAVIGDGQPAELLERWPPLDARLGAPVAVRERYDPPRPRGLPAGASTVLAISDLRAGYGDGRDVLDGVSLEIPRGTIAAWSGKNGTGKSTLARTIMGLLPARGGSITVSGMRVDQLQCEERAAHIGLVFQDPGTQLFSNTVLDEVAFGPRVLGQSSAAAVAAARDALSLVELDGEERTHPGDLSPQTRRLVALASAYAARPPLLILDEPTAGQDARGRALIVRVLDAQRGRGAAALITHDADFARRHCDLEHRFGRGTVH